MHPTLLAWLAAFDQSCQDNVHEPTKLYNDLVQLGVEKPGSGIAPRSGKNCGCDCVTIVADEQKQILESEKDIAGWMSSIPDAVRNKREYIAKCRESIALYTSLHANHAEYNRRVHESMKSRGLLAKVQQVCVRDLKTTTEDPAYCRIALRGYGLELRSFLVSRPKEWI